LSGLKDITVRAGETITFTLPYSSGGLKPSVDVLNGGQTIFEDDRTTVQVEDDKIVFTTTQSKRTDAGPYKVVVQVNGWMGFSLEYFLYFLLTREAV
jgi:hypothetical protein